MHYSLSRLNVTYERPFRQPEFRVARSAIEILESLYRAISPDYPIAMSDLTSPTALSVGDVAIRAGLFGGNGSLEINVEKFTARFEGLRNDLDIDIVKNVILLSETSINNTLTDMKYNGTAVRTSAWLICDATEESVGELLGKFSAPKLKIPASRLGAKEIRSKAHWQARDEQENWVITYLMEKSELPGTHLFVLCDGVYAEEGKFTTFEERAQHFQDFYRQVLEFYGLEPRPEG